ncbi:MAG: transcription antitermination factor NusB [Candidatus Dadabacteria bacterium]|nr:MAG: transcription antitermination factor NusB [Candidatus Dadabacteria bacterium]
MVTRRLGREFALQALYQCDALGEMHKGCIEWYYEAFHATKLEEDLEFSKSVAFGVIENLQRIDELITAASHHWTIDRMSRVDRNILRIGVFEIAYRDDIPHSVSINEAIEIAKRYAAEDTPMFVNGVLDRVASDLAAAPCTANILPFKKVMND